MAIEGSVSRIEKASLWFLEKHPKFEREKPYQFTYPLNSNIFPSNMNHESHEDIDIQDLREYIPPYEKSGIGILSLENALEYEDYDDPDKVERILLTKLREGIRTALGASAVHVIEFKLRKRDAAFPTSSGSKYEFLQPALGVHVDYTPDEVRKVVRALRGDDAEKWLTHRLEAIYLWSPLRGPLRDWPLCVCDASTVDYDDDLQAADVIFPSHAGENYQLHYNEKQRWYYLSDHMPTEFLFFRATDTARPKSAAVPHCSFQCSNSEGQDFRRESIEVRVVVLHDELLQ